MQRSLILFLVVLTYSCTTTMNQAYKYSIVDNDDILKGRVKSLSITRNTYSDSLPDVILYSSIDSYCFTENGKLAYEKLIHAAYGTRNDTLCSGSEVNYNDKGNMVAGNGWNIQGRDTTLCKDTFLYNAEDSLVAECNFNINNRSYAPYKYWHTWRTYSFDGHGNKTEKDYNTWGHDSLPEGTILGVNSQLPEKISKYNNAGNVIDEVQLFHQGQAIEKDTYMYDDAGNYIEKDIIDSPEFHFQRYAYKYDNKHEKTEEVVYRRKDNVKADDVLDHYVVFKYDDKGRPIETSNYDSSRSISNTECRKYDLMGYLIEDSTYNSLKRSIAVTKIQYGDFDKEGNYTQATMWLGTDSNRLAKRVIIRKFEYY